LNIKVFKGWDTKPCLPDCARRCLKKRRL